MRRRRKQGLSFYEKKEIVNTEILKEVALWILYTVVAVFIAFFAVYYFGDRISVIGTSMEPGLVSGQNVFVNRLSYRISSPKRGDVIAFYPGGNTDAHPYFKRVVAVPGDVVQILDGELMVNGVPDPDSDEYDKMEDAGIAEEPLTLGTGEYFVLGDNRNNSEDSRSAGIGAVREATIIGRAWLSLPEGDQGLGIIR
jgi:signal peptidase I